VNNRKHKTVLTVIFSSALQFVLSQDSSYITTFLFILIPKNSALLEDLGAIQLHKDFSLDMESKHQRTDSATNRLFPEQLQSSAYLLNLSPYGPF
jgi:hypothetical protein